MKSVIAFAVLECVLASCGQNQQERIYKLYEERRQAKKNQQQKATEHPGTPFWQPVLPTKAVAVAVAEPMLFAIYGRENILKQRPYGVYLNKGTWYISGSLPRGWIGGTFSIQIQASDGCVLALTHGR